MDEMILKAERPHIEKAMDIAMERLDDGARMECMMALMGGHHSAFTAMTAVGRMKPVVLLDADGKPWNGGDVNTYLAATGITPERIQAMVAEAHRTAKAKGGEYGITVKDTSGANQWDLYWCYAMMLSDHWFTHSGEPETIAMLVYEYFSDPDRG